MISETQKLQSLIVHYERQLHCQVTRCQKDVIDNLLHRDFFEIGRSGMRYDKQQVIDALISETAEQQIQADNFELSVVDEKSVLLTYLSYKAGENNIVSKTWRTSLWVRNVDSPNPDDWKMRFHQGTPTASSEATAND
ncbi:MULTISPECIES: nuclear transport factor 2 family protein [Pectobacterium]|uniref:nuclear transport factor 2 family protein n=1 Tax=Pectobacterium TaxID=122277 RepID=UPI0015821475|nr:MULTISPECIES: nuclear transport factor 2 family protein [Pectobacterium]MCY9847175.1 nuclear transport factor 2 family protein [Pectobacterium jejuense]